MKDTLFSTKLGRTFLVKLILLSTTLTILLAGGQLLLDYQKQVKDLKLEIESIQKTHIAPMSSALWSFNSKQIQILAKSLLALPGIRYAAIENNEGKIITKVGHLRQIEKPLKKTFPMFQKGNKAQPIGKLFVVADENSIWLNVQTQGFFNLLSQFFKTFVIAIFILFLLKKLVLDPISLINGKTEEYREKFILAEEYDTAKLILPISINTDNEIGALGKNINDLTRKMADVAITEQKTASELRAFNQQLKASQQQLKASNQQLKASQQQLKASNEQLTSKEKDLSNLREEQSKLQLSLEESISYLDMAALVSYTDAKGIITFANDNFCYYSKYSKEELLGQNHSIINSRFHPRDFWTEMWQTISSGKTWKGLIKNQAKDGSFYWVLTTNMPRYDENAKIIGYASIRVDITAQKIAEDSLKRTQKLDAIGKLTGGISHDFNNLLSVILSQAEILEFSLKDQPKLLKIIEGIKHATDRGADLTKKLLTFSQLKTIGQQNLDINQIISEQKNFLTKTLTARVSLIVNLSPVPCIARINKGDFQDSLLNMCINSMHAIKDSGKIIISTELMVLEDHEINSFTVLNGEYIEVKICDDGMGIEESELKKVFDPFYTTKGELGTGLGLSQVWGFAENCGGALKVASKKGEGTEIYMYFPKLDDKKKLQEPANPSESNQKENLYGTETVLLVDDEQALLELASEILGNYGYTTLTAKNGEEALELLKNNPVDLLFSDIIMPGMNGYQLARNARELFPTLKIQLTSGYDDKVSSLDADKDLEKSILFKPYKLVPLLTCIKKKLGSDH
ncbi:MAG: response regulator [Halobacteriovoraceae bacterium]|jgi:PAS domain S-box-containing protein|nr:response regulator [Halobacteriovoraceae bacterium]